jgi:predicted nucleic acid-binding protein
MKKLKIYLDTSIINFLFVNDAPDYRAETQRFFNEFVKTGKADIFISAVVIEEINNTTDAEIRKKLLGVFKEYKNIKVLKATNENYDDLAFLSQEYIRKKIIPQKKVADALHIAYSVVFEMDVLLSWNFKHLANINKERDILVVNKSNGFNYPFRMANPLEVQNGK